MHRIQTPYYLIDQGRLLENLEKAARLRELSGAKVLLALKCFATWSVFDLMRPYLDGTTTSSLYEVRLGRERFGGETHAYSVAYADDEMAEVVRYADKVIFNSVRQLLRFEGPTARMARGLRLNPRISASAFDLADPARPFSRLGEWDLARIEPVIDRISGFMIHYNCENADFARFDRMLSEIETRFGGLLKRVTWVSLGGGIHFTGADYPLESLAVRLRAFSDRFGVQVYLEPGEALVTGAATLEVTVQDLLHNGKDLAVVDSSIEAHMLDLLIYRLDARTEPNEGAYRYMICGKSCLAGDVFGECAFPEPLRVGDRISIQDAAGYTLVKKNWFNGLKMPSIVIKGCDGSLRLVREFGYQDYVSSLS